jgi:hypothetical protein
MNNLQALSHNRAAEAEADESGWRSQLIGSLPHRMINTWRLLMQRPSCSGKRLWTLFYPCGIKCSSQMGRVIRIVTESTRQRRNVFLVRT